MHWNIFFNVYELWIFEFTKLFILIKSGTILNDIKAVPSLVTARQFSSLSN